jgi:hypothetical protein
MKSSLTRLQWTALIGFVVIGLLGGVGLWLLSGKVDAAQDALHQKEAELKKLTGDRYFPGPANTEALQKDNQALQAALDVLQQRLLAPGNPLAQVAEKNPVVFKQELADQIHALTELAAKNNVHIEPTAVDFGFALYQNTNPSEAATRILGKQMIGIREAVTALLNAKVSSLIAVRRSFDERSGEAPAASGTASEALHARIVSPAGGFYTVYPLELEFNGSEAALRGFLSALTVSPYVLVTRSVTLNSLRTTPPHLDDVVHAIPTEGRKPSFVMVMGDDEVHARVRVDLIDWTGGPAAAAKDDKKGTQR